MTPVDVAPADLWAAYSADEVAADAKYKGRLLRVRGDVKAVGRKDGRPLVGAFVEQTVNVLGVIEVTAVVNPARYVRVARADFRLVPWERYYPRAGTPAPPAK